MVSASFVTLPFVKMHTMSANTMSLLSLLVPAPNSHTLQYSGNRFATGLVVPPNLLVSHARSSTLWTLLHIDLLSQTC